METNNSKRINRTRTMVGRALGTASAAGLLSLAGLAHAQDSVTMAPPIQGAYDAADPGNIPDSASQDTVFNWREVPANQRVPVTRAVFDKGGYQLYDNVGETIIVPFSNDDLYVMKFGISDDGSTYFVNDGSAPTLYLPHDGYLENATVTGAKWYPFPQDYHPAEPVFLGIAPSWNDYVDMGWYPDMAFYGGYYSHGPFISGAVVFPTLGLFIDIGGHSYHGWRGYRDYYDYHPDGFRLTIANNNFYRWGGHTDYDHRSFYGGGDHGGFDHFGGGHNFGGGYHAYGGGDHGFQGGGNRTFGNASGGVRPFGGNAGGGYRSFGSHTFRGGQGFGGNSGGRTYGGSQSFGNGGHTFGGGNTGGGNYGGSRSFGNTNAGGGDRSFGGGNHSSGGSNFGGGGNYSGSRSFGGGSRTSGNFSGNARPSGGNNGGVDHNSNSGGFGGFGGGGHSSGDGGGFGGGGHSFGGGGGGGGFHGGGGFGGGGGRGR